MYDEHGGADRKQIYDLIRSWGVELTPERHAILRRLLKQYVFNRSTHYLRVIDDLNRRNG